MITIQNRKSQPLTINLSEKVSLHLMAKGYAGSKAELSTEEFNSAEVKNHLAKGNIIVLKMD